MSRRAQFGTTSSVPITVLWALGFTPTRFHAVAVAQFLQVCSGCPPVLEEGSLCLHG